MSNIVSIKKTLFFSDQINGTGTNPEESNEMDTDLDDENDNETTPPSDVFLIHKAKLLWLASYKSDVKNFLNEKKDVHNFKTIIPADKTQKIYYENDEVKYFVVEDTQKNVFILFHGSNSEEDFRESCLKIEQEKCKCCKQPNIHQANSNCKSLQRGFHKGFWKRVKKFPFETFFNDETW